MTIDIRVTTNISNGYKRVHLFNQLVIMTEKEWQAFRSLLQPCADADFRIEPKEER